VAWSWVAAIVCILVGSWFASWVFYATTIDRQIELAKLQLQSQAARIAHDQRMNDRRHDANLIEHATTKQMIETNRTIIATLRHDIDVIRETVNDLKANNP
jgi:hypothetical protein